MKLDVVRDAEELAQEAARRIAEEANAAVAERGCFTLALAGGATPRLTYERLAAIEDFPWLETQVYWSDERSAPPDDPRSNVAMATEALLRRVTIPPENVHAPTAGAEAYEGEIRRNVEAFDLILLGLGADGHVASLFPGSPAWRESSSLVVETRAPDGERRLTFTPPLLLAARRLLMLVSGSEKSAALRALGSDAGECPAQALRAAGDRLTVVADQAAAR